MCTSRVNGNINTILCLHVNTLNYCVQEQTSYVSLPQLDLKATPLFQLCGRKKNYFKKLFKKLSGNLKFQTL